jgi:hypothetical protein
MDALNMRCKIGEMGDMLYTLLLPFHLTSF